MLTRRAVALGVALLAAVPTLVHAQGDAKAFLDRIYKAYVGKDAKGNPLNNDAMIRRTFVPAIAAAIIKDGNEAAKKGDAPILNADPFIDGQDFDIKSFNIAVKENGPDKATGTVKFRNFGKDATIVIDLVKLKDGWRIAEIRGPSGKLTEMFKR